MSIPQINLYKKIWWLGLLLFFPIVSLASTITAPVIISGPVNITVNTQGNYSVVLYASQEQEELQAVFDWNDGTDFSFSPFINTNINGVVTSPVPHIWQEPGQYYIKVQARDRYGHQSPWSAPFLVFVSVSSESNIPAPPTNLQITTKKVTAISLSWQDNSINENKFLIYRKNSIDSAWPTSPHGQVGANITFFNDTYQITPGNSYDYYVVACNSSNGCSAWSNIVTVTVGSTGDNTCTGFKLTTSKQSYLAGENLTYTWSCASGVLTFVQIQVLTPDNNVITYPPFQSLTGLNFYTGSLSTSNLIAGRHTLQACFTNSCATVTSSTNFDIILSGSGNDENTAPNPPSVLLASADGTAVNLSWPASLGAASYNLYRLVGPESNNWQLVFPAISTLAVTDLNLPIGSYKYKLEACNSNNICSGTARNQWVYSVTVTISNIISPEVLLTISTHNGSIIPSGLIALVYQNRVESLVFNYSASASLKLPPGVYELQPSFPGVNNDQIQFSGSGVNGRQLSVGMADISIQIILPEFSPVNVLVQDSEQQPVAQAQVKLGLLGSSLYTSAFTNSAGMVWLQLAPGEYRGLVTKSGFAVQNFNLNVTVSGAEKIIQLITLPLNVSGQVWAAGVAKAGAAVQAYNPSTQAILVSVTDNSGYYNLSLDKGKWILSAMADGYYRSQPLEINIAGNLAGFNLNLGAAIPLITTINSIVPTSNATVLVPELGVKVSLPANSLGSGSTATLTVQQSSYNVATATAAPLAGAVRRITAEHASTPVTRLNRAILLEFDYTEADLLALGVKMEAAAGLKLAFWQTEHQEWQVLDSVVDQVNRKVRATTTHFTIFAIVLPFIAQPASAQVSSPAESSSEPIDGPASQFAAILAEGTKVYVSGPDALALSVNKKRDLSLEQKYEAEILPKVINKDNPPAGIRSTILNFITYGTLSTIHLGAGERGGVVASFRAAYGRWPQSEYEWQEILKIANGRWPGSLLPEREQTMKNSFQKIYLRAPQVTNPHDSAALAIMAYGLRSAKRHLTSEAAAINSFRYIYGYNPASAADWDVVRAIAYSGAKR